MSYNKRAVYKKQEIEDKFMAGTIVHLLITDGLMNRLDIENRKEFILGSLAPDTIHAKPDYVRDDKRKSHLRLGIRDAHFHQPEKLDLFKSRVEAFRQHIKGEKKDLFLGYLCHVMVDELYIMTIRRAYTKAKELEGHAYEDKCFYEQMIKESEYIDRALWKKYDLNHYKSMVLTLPFQDILDLVPADYQKISVHWMVKNKFVDKTSIQTEYITLYRIEAFIDMAIETLIDRLSRKTLYGLDSELKIFYDSEEFNISED